MTEIRPSYYAAGNYRYDFEILGGGFSALPLDVVGVPMISNDNPLQFRNDQSAEVVMRLAERSPNRIVMRAERAWNHTTATIGALLSSDRSIVYWVNDTNPLP